MKTSNDNCLQLAHDVLCVHEEDSEMLPCVAAEASKLCDRIGPYIGTEYDTLAECWDVDKQIVSDMLVALWRACREGKRFAANEPSATHLRPEQHDGERCSMSSPNSSK